MTVARYAATSAGAAIVAALVLLLLGRLADPLEPIQFAGIVLGVAVGSAAGLYVSERD